MRATAIPHSELAVPSARTLAPPLTHGVTARLGRAVDVAADALLAAAFVICIPFVILAIGIPIALFVQLLLWIVRLI